MDFNAVIDPMNAGCIFTWFWGYIRTKDKKDISAEKLQKAITTLKKEYTIDIDDKYKKTPADVVFAASADMLQTLIGDDYLLIGDYDEEDENKLYIEQRGEMQWNTPSVLAYCLLDLKLVEEIKFNWLSESFGDLDDLHGSFLSSRLVYDAQTDDDIKIEDLKLTAE